MGPEPEKMERPVEKIGTTARIKKLEADCEQLEAEVSRQKEERTECLMKLCALQHELDVTVEENRRLKGDQVKIELTLPSIGNSLNIGIQPG